MSQERTVQLRRYRVVEGESPAAVIVDLKSAQAPPPGEVVVAIRIARADDFFGGVHRDLAGRETTGSIVMLP